MPTPLSIGSKHPTQNNAAPEKRHHLCFLWIKNEDDCEQHEHGDLDL
jgi:hypothetical protein